MKLYYWYVISTFHEAMCLPDKLIWRNMRTAGVELEQDKDMNDDP